MQAYLSRKVMRRRAMACSLLTSLLALVIAAPVPAVAQSVVATIPVDHQPTGIAANPTTNRVYVANYTGDTLSVINAATNSVITTVAMGNGPLGVAVNPSLNRIYVSNSLADTISVVDGASNAVVATIAAKGPASLDVDPITNRVYAALEADRRVAVLDGATNLVVGSISVPGPGTVSDVAVNPLTNRVYVVSQFPSMLTMIDAGTIAVLQAVPLVSVSLDVNETTDRVYGGGNPLAVFAGATISAVTTVPLSAPGATTRDSIAVNPASNRIYVADFSRDILDIIAGATNTRTATLAGFKLPHSVTANPNTGRAYVTNTGNDTVSVIEDAVRPAADHYKCYGLTRRDDDGDDDDAKTVARPKITLDDQFGKYDAKVGADTELCTPVSKDGGTVNQPNAHLVTYKIKSSGVAFSKRRVEVKNQFGTQLLDLRKPTSLAVPSSKSTAGTPGDPPKLLDHFQCYAVQREDAEGDNDKRGFPPRTVVLKDQFKEEKVRVSGAVAVCNPVKKTHKGEVTPIGAPGQHLVCYTIKAEKFEPIDVKVRNQFGDAELRVVKPMKLCVPSEKREVPSPP